MAIKSKAELLEIIKNKVGDDTSDEALSLIEDVTDTLNDLDKEDWKTKYEENDKSWREKYKQRFFNSDHGEDDPDDEDEKPKSYSYDKLFKED